MDSSTVGQARLETPRWARVALGAACIAVGLVLLPTTAWAADNTVSATGRAVWVDEDGNDRGIPGARVRLCDRDEFLGVGFCDLLATGTTSATGHFSLTGTDTGEDGASELYVEVIADNTRVRVAPFLNPGTYCFRTGLRDTGHGDTAAFGTLRPLQQLNCTTAAPLTDPRENAAWFAFTLIHRAQGFMTTANIAVGLPAPPKVTVSLDPDDKSTSFYFADHVTLRKGGWDPGVSARETILHEYGHHLMVHFADSPLPDYDNDICGGEGTIFGIIPELGHCQWYPEQGAVAWTEGVPTFLAYVIDAEVNTDLAPLSGFSHMITSLVDGRQYWQRGIETPASLVVDDPGSDHVVARLTGDRFAVNVYPSTDFAHIEGFTSTVLWDLYDDRDDDHNGDGRWDRVSLHFFDIWDVITRHDPDPVDADRTHVLDVMEFYDGVIARLGHRVSPSQVAGVFWESNFEVPTADLHVSDSGLGW